MTNLNTAQLIRLTDLARRENPHMSTTALIDFVAEVESIVFRPDVNTHDGLVQFALDNDEVMSHAGERKINAIKVLRQQAGVGLKEAKDAVEDKRVQDRAAVLALRAKLTGTEDVCEGGC